jgi:hypothetical protein
MRRWRPSEEQESNSNYPADTELVDRLSSQLPDAERMALQSILRIRKGLPLATFTDQHTNG